MREAEVRVNKHVSTVLAAALFIVATLLVFQPELRIPPMRAALWTLWMVVVGPYLMKAIFGGMLTMTPKQIYTTLRIERSGATALEAAASLMAIAADIVY